MKSKIIVIIYFYRFFYTSAPKRIHSLSNDRNVKWTWKLINHHFTELVNRHFTELVNRHFTELLNRLFTELSTRYDALDVFSPA